MSGIGLSLLLNVCEQSVEVVEQRRKGGIWQRQVQHLILCEILTNECELFADVPERPSKCQPAPGEKNGRSTENDDEDGGEHGVPSLDGSKVSFP